MSTRTAASAASAQSRFMARWKEDATGCWLWTAGKNKAGYGYLAVAGRHVRAHRYAYELHHGPIPDDLIVMHSCDTPSCVNPAHLVLGTWRDNSQDMSRKGRAGLQRHMIGPNGRTLTPALVVEIRHRRATEHLPYSALAHDYGVSISTIANVCWRTTWKLIP